MRKDKNPDSRSPRKTLHARIEGVVQGVGFRPFVWRLANELGLDGTVINKAGRVEIEIAGPASAAPPTTCAATGGLLTSFAGAATTDTRGRPSWRG